MKIRIKYFDKSMPKINRIKKGDWIDLRAADHYEYKAGESVKVLLGVAMELPLNHEAHVAARSGTFKNYGLLLVNGVGVIDESYKGNEDQWFATFYATRDGQIERYDRVCQFRIMEKMPEVVFEEVDSLADENRGGEGSTGAK